MKSDSLRRNWRVATPTLAGTTMGSKVAPGRRALCGMVLCLFRAPKKQKQTNVRPNFETLRLVSLWFSFQADSGLLA